MSNNLGAYKEIVERAKASGGVELLLAQIKTGAVAKAAPKYRGQGLILGFAAGTVLSVAGIKAPSIVRELKGRWAERGRQIAAGADAEEKLTTVVDSEADPHETFEGFEESSDGE